jgi:hypothetical protein
MNSGTSVHSVRVSSTPSSPTVITAGPWTTATCYNDSSKPTQRYVTGRGEERRGKQSVQNRRTSGRQRPGKRTALE